MLSLWESRWALGLWGRTLLWFSENWSRDNRLLKSNQMNKPSRPARNPKGSTLLNAHCMVSSLGYLFQLSPSVVLNQELPFKLLTSGLCVSSALRIVRDQMQSGFAWWTLQESAWFCWMSEAKTCFLLPRSLFWTFSRILSAFPEHYARGCVGVIITLVVCGFSV